MKVRSNFYIDSNLNNLFEHNEPSICPICGHAIKPVQIIGKLYSEDQGRQRIVFLYLCQSCYNAFICQYNDVSSEFSPSLSKNIFKSDHAPIIGPIKFKVADFEEIITKTSPSFVKIYNQALEAENLNLDEIAGIGYRKALEFLIKDFLISKSPDDKEKIEKSMLGLCVNNYIDNPQLKTAASRAVWLGNDQTHYIQKFTDRDINDLKKLIRLTVHWISMILETEEAATIDPIR